MPQVMEMEISNPGLFQGLMEPMVKSGLVKSFSTIAPKHVIVALFPLDKQGENILNGPVNRNVSPLMVLSIHSADDVLVKINMFLLQIQDLRPSHPCVNGNRSNLFHSILAIRKKRLHLWRHQISNTICDSLKHLYPLTRGLFEFTPLDSFVKKVLKDRQIAVHSSNIHFLFPCGLKLLNLPG